MRSEEKIRMESFGGALATARKAAGLSQKEVADTVLKDDGTSISPQYLNDLEHNRRNPPSEHLTRQLAGVLGLSLDYLSFLAGQLPDDFRGAAASPEQVDRAFVAFRRALRDRK
jgi:transcriptional regulator with XRE-family HTH domain